MTCFDKTIELATENHIHTTQEFQKQGPLQVRNLIDISCKHV